MHNIFSNYYRFNTRISLFSLVLLSLLLIPNWAFAQSANPFDFNSSPYNSAGATGSYGNTSQMTSNQTIAPSVSIPTIPQNVPGLQSAQNGLMGMSSVNMLPFSSGGFSYGFSILPSLAASIAPGMTGVNDYYGFGMLPPVSTSSFDGNICDMPCKTTGYYDPTLTAASGGPNFGSGFGGGFGLGSSLFGSSFNSITNMFGVSGSSVSSGFNSISNMFGF